MNHHRMNTSPFLKFFLLVFILISPWQLSAEQDNKINYNEYYRFPFSLGISYQSLTPFSDYGSDFNVYEISGNFRFPLQRIPELQPCLQLGMAQYDSRDYLGDGDKWDHTQLFSGMGLTYTNRFSKDFEIGMDLIGGGAFTIFQNLDNSTNYSLPYIYAESGGYLALTPSYNLSIEVRSKIKYQYGITTDNVILSDFNGFALGLGLGIHYRTGTNPDTASSIIRSIRFSDTIMPSAFAAMQSYYIENPIGTTSLSNKEKLPIDNVEISFYQSGLMDAPTPCYSIKSIQPGENVEIPLYAFFNDNIFETEGVTPYTGEIIVQYEYRNRTVEQRHSVSYDLYDKTALTWDNEEKVAAFITPSDSALRNYTSYIRQAVKDKTISSFNRPLQEAIQIYNALDVIGCLYQSDPSAPFTTVQGNTQLVDSVSLPRDTLKRITGDCDDLTVLYCSLLETLGIETAFITVPGHIYAAFNTKISSSKYSTIHPDRSMTINLNGELWVPVEITLIGTSSFPEAWSKGASQWKAHDEQVESRGFFRTLVAQETFRPVALKEADLGLQYGNAEVISNNFQNDFKVLEQLILSSYEEKAENRQKKQDYNQLGIKYSIFERYEEARRAFDYAVKLDRNYLPAKVNQANLEFLLGNYRRALSVFSSVLENLENRGKSTSSFAGKLMINIARSYYNSEQYDKARTMFARAELIVPRESLQYAYLSSSTESTTRASAIGMETSLLFIEDVDYEE